VFTRDTGSRSRSVEKRDLQSLIFGALGRYPPGAWHVLRR
jgi:hypothetical protein